MLKAGEKLVPSNLASISGSHPNDSETLIGGTLQGRKQFSLPGASRVCKRRMWQFALSLAAISCKSILVNLDNRKDEGIRGRTFERFTLRKDADENKLLADHPVVQCLKADTYAEVKEGKLLESRRNVKREVREMALEGWVRNEGGEGFGSDGLMGGK